MTFCSTSACAITAALRLKDFGMRLVIRGHDRLVLLAVARVVATFRGTPLLGV
jgi:hypothetical protein